MHIDVYRSTRSPGAYLLVRRGTGRVSAPEAVRSEFVPGELVKQLRMISTDTIAGLDSAAVIAAIQQERYFVATGPVDFERVTGQRLPR